MTIKRLSRQLRNDKLSYIFKQSITQKSQSIHHSLEISTVRINYENRLTSLSTLRFDAFFSRTRERSNKKCKAN